MRVFVDTSAFLAVMDADEENHQDASLVWEHLMRVGAELFCTNYVLVETISLVQRRLGMPIANIFYERVVPMLNTIWIDESLHEIGLAALLVANRRRLSLVDCVSFEVARRHGVDAVFAFDQHFIEQGFNIVNTG
jgi:predicted nucleic acid-binding protein